MAPVYLALLLLVAFSLIGFGLALWHQDDPARSTYRSEVGVPTRAGRLSDEDLRPVPIPAERRVHGTWM